MRLQTVHNGTVYATHGRDVVIGSDSGSFEPIGRLPLPRQSRWSFDLQSRILTSPLARLVTDRVIGRVSMVNVWPLDGSNLLGTVGRQLSVSPDGGKTWKPTRLLPSSSGPMGVLPPAVAYQNGQVFLGEYPLDSSDVPRILASSDRGRTWNQYASLQAIRHVHAVQVDPYTGDLWVTTGDTNAESYIGRLEEGAFTPVGGGSQDWRAVELAFTPSSILWGMDCVYADTNRIFSLPRDELAHADPQPTPVCEVPGSVYYSAAADVNGETWVAFSTAMETGSDSTGPANQNGGESNGLVVVSSSATGFTDWKEIASFRRRKVLADSVRDFLPRANGYVFIAAHSSQGLYINPYNTASCSGRIFQIPPHRFENPRPLACSPQLVQ